MTEVIWAGVVKTNKRLHIIDIRSGEVVYTPPDFVRIPNREALRGLATSFNWLGRRSIDEIAQFEWEHSHRRLNKRRKF